MSKMKVYTIDGNSYLGVRDEEEYLITGISYNAGASDLVGDDIIAEYLKAKKVDELVVLELGNTSTLVTRDLTRREKLAHKNMRNIFKEAKSMAKDHLVNGVFDELRGKK